MSLELVKVLAFGLKVNIESMSREFDITTPEKLVEFKNINWNKCDEPRIKSTSPDQRLIANCLEKKIELHSNRRFPTCCIKWFEKKNIIAIQESNEHTT